METMKSCRTPSVCSDKLREVTFCGAMCGISHQSTKRKLRQKTKSVIRLLPTSVW